MRSETFFCTEMKFWQIKNKRKNNSEKLAGSVWPSRSSSSNHPSPFTATSASVQSPIPAKQNIRDSAWLSKLGVNRSVRHQRLSEIRVGKSRKLASLHYVLKSESDEFVMTTMNSMTTMITMTIMTTKTTMTTVTTETAI